MPLVAGATDSEIGVFLAPLAAFAVLAVGAAVCEPAVAACLVADDDGASSALAIEVELTLTGLGTGYSAGIDPRFAYV